MQDCSLVSTWQTWSWMWFLMLLWLGVMLAVHGSSVCAQLAEATGGIQKEVEVTLTLFWCAHTSTFLSNLWNDTMKCSVRPSISQRVNYSSDLSLSPSFFGGRWFLSGPYLPIYSDYLTVVRILRGQAPISALSFSFYVFFFSLSKQEWSLTGHENGIFFSLLFLISFAKELGVRKNSTSCRGVLGRRMPIAFLSSPSCTEAGWSAFQS